MIKNKTVFLAVSILMLATSCKKSFIELTPESNLTEGNFYKSEGDFNQALVGAYQATRTALTDMPSWMMGEMRSDNTHYEQAIAGQKIDAAIDIADFTDDASNINTNDKYYQLYTGISRCNIILTRIAPTELSQIFKDSITAHAEFLRGLFYLELVQYYGGVPLYLSEIKTAGESLLPRASKEDVYTQIQADLEDAVSKLANPSFPQTGRATKGSAKMALAYLYMVKKDYANAEKELKDITAMNYALLPDYAAVFDPANKNSTESIFEVQFQAGNQGQESDFIYYFLPSCSNTFNITGVSTSNTAFKGLSGGWNIPTPAMIASYESGDKRLDASIAIAEGTGPVGNFLPERVVSVVGYTPPPGKEGKPFIKKYLHPHTTAYNTDDDWPIYRYADVLLLLAQALNEQNKTSEALPYLNQVRTRAGLADITTTDQSQLRDIIAHERKVELAFENKRWLDLVRTGKAVPVMTAYGTYIKSLYPSLLPSTYNITDDKLIFPIPARELQVNPQLTQNPGY